MFARRFFPIHQHIESGSRSTALSETWSKCFLLLAYRSCGIASYLESWRLKSNRSNEGSRPDETTSSAFNMLQRR